MKSLSLIVVVLALIASCKSKDTAMFNAERLHETRAVIETTIEDAERRSEMLEVVGSLESQMAEIGADVKDLREQVVEANRDYTTTRKDLERLYGELGKQVGTLASTVKDHSLKLRGYCSEAEWAQLVDSKTETFHFSF